MKIDPHLVPLIRDALAAAMVRDRERFHTALLVLSATDERAGESMALMLAIDATALRTAHPGRPTEPQVAALARQFASSETWSGVGEPTARRFLTGLAAEQYPPPGLSTVELVYAAYAVGAWLLTSFPKATWIDFLTAILHKLAAVPVPR